MKFRVSQHTALPSLPHRNSRSRSRLMVTTIVAVLLTVSCQTLLAQQENFLVMTQDGVASLYDLASYSLLESFQNEPYTYTVSASPNQRLAFMAGGSGYGSATDTSIARAVTSLTGVRGSASTIGHGGKYYLVSDFNKTLDVVDTATLAVVQILDFSSIIPRNGLSGAIVAANNQAYVFPRGSQSSKVAVVNLANFQLSSILLPVPGLCRRCASRTPDGSLVVAVGNEGGKTHVLLISTSTNTIVQDIAQTKNYGVQSVVVTPNSSGPLYGYVFSSSSNSVITLDLRPNSQTYGQILANTAVTIPNLSLGDMAINSDGSRVIVAGSPSMQPPAPNVAVVDTVNQVLATELTVDGGVSSLAVCTGFFSTTPPGGAPTVTGTSGGIINNQDNVVTITGTDFQPGALVRIGSLPQLPADVSGSTSLTVTVPTGVPAGKAQDIIVTNPMTNMPPNQQNESGLLAGAFNILPNPNFQPTTQFAAGNALLYVYDLKQQSMVNVPTGHSGDDTYGSAFNVDGKDLYLANNGYIGNYVLPIDLSTNTPDPPISLPANAYNFAQLQPIGAGLDPEKSTPVIYAFWFDSNDLHLSKIDSDPSSKTFNTIVGQFDAGLSQNSYPTGYNLALTIDSKYAYVWYYTDNTYLGIFNLVTGAFTSIRYDALRVSSYQSQIGIAPDGKSMLLSTFRGNRTGIKVFDISNPTNPKSLVELTPGPIPRRGAPYVDNCQVIGNKLYAIDLSGAVVVFNFDRTKGDFRERGWVASNKTEGYSAFGFSADGAYLYLADYYADLVLVADTNKLASRGDPTVTNLRSPYTPYLLAVSPVPPPMKGATAKKSGQQHQSCHKGKRSRKSPVNHRSLLPN